MINRKPWQPTLHSAEPWLRFAAMQVLPAIRRSDPTTPRRRPYNPVDIDNPEWFQLTVLELFATNTVDAAACARRPNENYTGVASATAHVERMFTQFCYRRWWDAFDKWDLVAAEGITIRRAAAAKVSWESSFHGNRSGISDPNVAVRRVSDQLKSLCFGSTFARIGGTLGLQIDAINVGMSLVEATEELTELLEL